MGGRWWRPALIGAWLGAVLLAAACSNGSSNTPSSSGPPAVEELAPRQVRNDQENLIILKGSGFRWGVRVAVGPYLIGQQVQGRVTWVNDSVVTARFAPGLPPGTYEVGVTNLDGRFASLKEALLITGPAATQAPSPTRTSPPTPTATPTPTQTPTPSPSPTATRTPTPGPSPTPVPSPSPTNVPPTRGPASPTPAPAASGTPGTPPPRTGSATPTATGSPAAAQPGGRIVLPGQRRGQR